MCIIFPFFSKKKFICHSKAWAHQVLQSFMVCLHSLLLSNITSAPNFLSLSRCLCVILTWLNSNCLAQSPHLKPTFVPTLWFLSARHLSLIEGSSLSLHCSGLVSLCQLNPIGKSKCPALIDSSLITCLLLPLENFSSFLSRTSFYKCQFFPSAYCLSLCPLIMFSQF